MQRIVHSASAFLDYFDSPSPSGNAHFNSQSIKPLLLPARPDFAEVLSQQGCSIATVSTLSQMMETSGVQIEQTHRAALKSAMRELAGQFGSAEAAEFRKWETAVGDGIVRRYMRAIEQLQETVIQEIQAAKSRYSTSSPSPSTPSILSHPRLAQEASTEAAGNFTEEVVGILHKAFETKATLTRAEVKSLSAVTHLNTKQIRTWFANQRQRRGGRKGAAPYNLAISRQPPTQRNIPSTPRRNVSNSSSNSSLLSYADSSACITPPHPHQQDVFSSPIEYTPSPPQHQEVQAFPSYAPAHPQDFDVPMMHYTEPTPITAQSTRPPPLPLSTPHFPLPSPPTTAQTDSFFSLPVPPSQTPPLSYSPTDSSPFPSPPQQHSTTQHESSFLDQLQSTDPFLDDQFLENVFGNLGVTANGGLTLMMDSFEDEGGLKGGDDGGGFSLGW